MKVRPVGTPAHPPREYAHLPCTVQVDFYGSPHSGATLTAVTQAPTSPVGQTLLTATVTFTQTSANPRGNELVGSTVLDFSQAVEGLSRHPQQGYHVKLTAVQDGPQGGDVKHKVFWIDCDSDAAVAEQSGGDDAVDEAAVSQVGARDVATAEDEDSATVSGSEVAGLSGLAGRTEVAGVYAERDVDAGADGAQANRRRPLLAGFPRLLASTGLGTVTLLVLGLVGLGAGAGMLRRFRRR